MGELGPAVNHLESCDPRIFRPVPRSAVTSDAPVTVVSVQRFESEAVELAYDGCTC